MTKAKKPDLKSGFSEYITYETPAPFFLSPTLDSGRKWFGLTRYLFLFFIIAEEATKSGGHPKLLLGAVFALAWVDM